MMKFGMRRPSRHSRGPRWPLRKIMMHCTVMPCLRQYSDSDSSSNVQHSTLLDEQEQEQEEEEQQLPPPPPPSEHLTLATVGPSWTDSNSPHADEDIDHNRVFDSLEYPNQHCLLQPDAGARGLAADVHEDPADLLCRQLADSSSQGTSRPTSVTLQESDLLSGRQQYKLPNFRQRMWRSMHSGYNKDTIPRREARIPYASLPPSGGTNDTDTLSSSVNSDQSDHDNLSLLLNDVAVAGDGENGGRAPSYNAMQTTLAAGLQPMGRMALPTPQLTGGLQPMGRMALPTPQLTGGLQPMGRMALPTPQLTGGLQPMGRMALPTPQLTGGLQPMGRMALPTPQLTGGLQPMGRMALPTPQLTGGLQPMGRMALPTPQLTGGLQPIGGMAPPAPQLTSGLQGVIALPTSPANSDDMDTGSCHSSSGSTSSNHMANFIASFMQSGRGDSSADNAVGVSSGGTVLSSPDNTRPGSSDPESCCSQLEALFDSIRRSDRNCGSDTLASNQSQSSNSTASSHHDLLMQILRNLQERASDEPPTSTNRSAGASGSASGHDNWYYYDPRLAPVQSRSPDGTTTNGGGFHGLHQLLAAPNMVNPPTYEEAQAQVELLKMLVPGSGALLGEVPSEPPPPYSDTETPPPPYSDGSHRHANSDDGDSQDVSSEVTDTSSSDPADSSSQISSSVSIPDPRLFSSHSDTWRLEESITAGGVNHTAGQIPNPAEMTRGRPCDADEAENSTVPRHPDLHRNAPVPQTDRVSEADTSDDDPETCYNDSIVNSTANSFYTHGRSNSLNLGLSGRPPVRWNRGMRLDRWASSQSWALESRLG